MSKIEWTGITINPFVGCDWVSPGCDHCYAVRMAHRKAGVRKTPYYKGTTTYDKGVVWTGQINKAPDHIIQAPLKRKKATTYFLCSVSDFFHKNAEDAWREEALEVAEKCQQHTFQILTKRPQNIDPFLERTGAKFPTNVWIGATVENRKHVGGLRNCVGPLLPYGFFQLNLFWRIWGRSIWMVLTG